MKRNGFTLIELIVVIIMLGILSATVIPRFMTSEGFEEYAYRVEVIATLRAIQLRAMQETGGNSCREIQISALEIGLLKTTPGTSSNGCESTLAGETTSVTIDGDHQVTFSEESSFSSFCFSSLGRPVNCTTGNVNEVTFSIAGESSLKVNINAEGYIHAS